MAKNVKTNAARLLDRAGVAYSLQAYEVDENDLSATHLAATLGQDIRRVFKTIVLVTDKREYFVCVVPGDAEIDLKKAAKVYGAKKAELIHMKELLPLTGYIRGGCSPIGMKKQFPTFFHSTVKEFDTIYVSAGQRGLQFVIAPDDLVSFVNGKVADLIL